jgi:hypothetical protein
MIPTLFVSLLGAVLLSTVVLGTVNPAGGPGPINARNATGGPVKPATTRDYIMVTIFFALAIAAILIGLANMG